MTVIKYSVIVCTYNGAKTIEECIISLLKQNIPKGDYEIIIVDDESTDDTQLKVKKFITRGENLRLLSQKHKGLSSARNLGLTHSKGGIVLFTDDDAVVDEDWIMRIVSEYTPDIAGVGGYSRPYSEDIFSFYDYGMGILAYGKNAEKIDGAGGLNMSFRKETLKKIGGFDPVFTSVADDADINKRLTSARYKLKVVPGITVKHRSPPTLKDFCRKKFNRGKGNYLFLKKYGKKHIFLASLASFMFRLLNVPGAISSGFRIAKITRQCNTVYFAFLAWLDSLLLHLGTACAFLENRVIGEK